VSIDKDFCTIPETWFYNYYRDELMYNERDAADYFWLTQCLKGDPVDGYYAIKRCGNKTAEKILSSGATWETVLAAYVIRGYSVEYALQQSRVARILRKGEYDNGKIHLWSPEKTFEKTIDTTVEPVVY
jgi:5'-3' exonuclease